VGQERLAELAHLLEMFLADCVKKGGIEPGSAAVLVTAASAFNEVRKRPRRSRRAGRGGESSTPCVASAAAF
jgi:hypothetical protein